jgi:AraC family transcriptional regulator
MKKETINRHTKIANAIMYYIYKYVDTEINLDELSRDLGVSKFHMHRIFKSEFGLNIYESIKSIRLQKASSLLLTNKNSTITQVANMCGYSSHTSFIKAYRSKFAMTPSHWREEGYKEYIENILKKSQSATDSSANFSSLTPNIVKMQEIRAYYVRHHGYDRSIKESWQKLQTWALCNDITSYTQIGVHHDNPTITPLSECNYIACISLQEEISDASLPMLVMPSGVYARFDFNGEYGDVLKFMNWVYFEWLVRSGYETTTNPPYAIYHKNHFLAEDGAFSLSYYIPIRL